MLKLGTPTLQRFGQWTARVFTQRVGHAFDEPRWRKEKGMHASDVLHLEVVDQFVSCEMRMPSTRTNDNSEGSDVVRGIACKAKAFRALCRRAEDVSGHTAQLANSRLYEADRLVAKNLSLFQFRQVVDTDVRFRALDPSELWSKNAYGLESSPGYKREDCQSSEHETRK